MKKSIFALSALFLFVLSSCGPTVITGEEVPELAANQIESNKFTTTVISRVNTLDKSVDTYTELYQYDQVTTEFFSNDVMKITEVLSITGNEKITSDDVGDFSLFQYHNDGITYQLYEHNGEKTKYVLEDADKSSYLSSYQIRMNAYSSVLSVALSIHSGMQSVGTSEFNSDVNSTGLSEYSLTKDGTAYTLYGKGITKTNETDELIQETTYLLGINSSGYIYEVGLASSQTLNDEYVKYSQNVTFSLEEIKEYSGTYPKLDDYQTQSAN